MDPPAADPAIERWRQYLLLLARVQLGPARRGQPEASDLVQQTLARKLWCGYLGMR